MPCRQRRERERRIDVFRGPLPGRREGGGPVLAGQVEVAVVFKAHRPEGLADLEAAHGVGLLGLGGGGDFRERGPAHTALALAHAAAGEALDFVDVAEAFGHGLADIPGGDAFATADQRFVRDIEDGRIGCEHIAQEPARDSQTLLSSPIPELPLHPARK